MALKVLKTPLMGLCSFVGILGAAGVQAGDLEGATWLSNQLQQQSLISQHASSLQTLHEAAIALGLYQQNIPALDLNPLLLNEESTEGLVRAAILTHAQGGDASSYLLLLKDRQNADGGFGHLKDWQSNPLDTAWVLLAQTQLQSTNNIATAQALSYLINQQRVDGSFQVVSLDNLYVTAYVLNALTQHAKAYPAINASLLKTISFLESKQISAGQWTSDAEGLFLDALLNEALHPYRGSAPVAEAAFKQRALQEQQSDGSWQSDAYTSAIVLQSLKSQSTPVVNPITSSILFNVIDTETGFALPEVQVTTTSDSASQLNTVSDSSGNISFKDVSAGDYRFNVSREGFSTLSFQVALRQGESLNLGQIKLSRQVNATTAQIQGKVTDKTTGQPIENATVTVTSQGVTQQVQTGVEGTYQVILAQPNSFTIEISKSGYVAVQGAGTATAGGVFSFTPQLLSEQASIANVTGRIVDKTGIALAGVSILRDGVNLATTDSAGNFSITGTKAGSFVLKLQKQDYQGPDINLSIPAGQTANVGTVTMVAVDPNNQNLDPALQTGTLVVQVLDVATNIELNNFSMLAEKLNASNQVIQSQSFSVSNDDVVNQAAITLTTGKWRITVSHPSYQNSYLSTAIYTVQANQTQNVTLKLTLKSIPYQLKGKVVDSQTNQVVPNANIRVLKKSNGQQLFTGKIDVSGQFTFNNVNADLISVEVTSAPHLSTTRYIDKKYIDGALADLGEIRIRPLSAEISMSDLVITKTDTTGLSTDQQSLQTVGLLKVTVENKGNSSFGTTKPIKLSAFADTNRNRKLDADEPILGTSDLNQPLAVNESVDINVDIQGQSLFKDAPIGVWIDSEQQVAESKEDNNVRMTSDGVEIKPQQGTLEAIVAWQRNIGSDSSPVAAPLGDTNGDGLIGKGDISSIIIYSGGYKVLNGKTGVLEFSLPGYGAQEVAAIADVDGDHVPDIVITSSDGVRVYSNIGVLKKILSSPPVGTSGWADTAIHPNIADLDQDGIPEIIVGRNIYNYTQGLIRTNLTSEHTQAVADINGDGYLDIIGRDGAVDRNGVQFYKFARQLKFLAVGDVLGSGKPQVVGLSGSTIYIIDAATGKDLATYNAPSSAGGSPVIADFDGDGIADFGLARTYSYVAMRGDGSIIWSTPISDGSGGTGSTVFDFDGDGKLEAVHYDERNLRVYDAATGVERILIPNSTPTAHEYPIVVDADADGHADIIIASRYGNGVRMISGKNKDWANTRNIWNQYSYHVTNINDDLIVPAQESNSWEVHNTYRANLIPGVNGTTASDATASYVQIEDNGISANSVFKVRIGNAGGKQINKDLPISFYRLAPNSAPDAQPVLLGTTLTTKALNAGEYEDVVFNYSGNLSEFGELVIVANSKGNSSAVEIQEYTLNNNTARLTIASGFEKLTLNAGLDKAQYTAKDNVTITASTSNLGSFGTDAVVRHTILDSVGNVIAVLPDQPVTYGAASSATANQSQAANWALTSVYKGSYVVKTELIKQGVVVATTHNPLEILSDAAASGLTATRLSTDKQQYNPFDTVTVNQQLTNTSSNDLGGEVTVLTELLTPDGQVYWSQSKTYPQLPAQAIQEEHYQVQLTNVPAGIYVVRTTTSSSGQATYSTQASLSVASSAQTGAGLIGALNAAPSEVIIGEQVVLNLQVQNNGNADWNNLPLTIYLFKQGDDNPVGSIPVTVAQLAKGQVHQQAVSWQAIGQDKDLIQAVLTYKNATGAEKALAQASLSLKVPPLKVELPTQPSGDNQLLVYYNCHAGWHASVVNWNFGKFSYACFSERGNLAKSYLDQIKAETGVSYTLTYNPTEFNKLMRSGLYNNYWVLGAVEKFNRSTNDEVRELTNNGQSVLFDSGILSWTNYELYDLVDVRYRGHILLSDSTMTPTSPVYPDISTIGKPKTQNKQFALKMGSKSIVTATYDGRYCTGFQQDWVRALEVFIDVGFYACNSNNKYPAMITANYGSGKPISMSFDLLNSLQQFGSDPAGRLQWKELLKQTLSYQKVDYSNRVSYVPKEAVNLTVNLTGVANTTANIVVNLPVGATWLGSGQVVNNQVQLTISLTNSDVKPINLPLRLPSNSGTHAVKVSVYNGTDVSRTALASLEHRFLVRSVPERLALVKQQVNSWSIFNSDGGNVALVKAKIRLVETKLALGQDDFAIGVLGEAGGIMSKMNMDVTSTRTELDNLMRAVQIQWFNKQN